MYGFSSFYFYLYLILGLIVVLFKLFGGKDKNCYLFLCFILLLLSAFRGYGVGGDLENYLPEFRRICDSKGISGAIEVVDKDFGYAVLIKLLSYISTSERFFLVSTSIISLIGPFWFIKKYSPWPIYSLFLYYSFGYYTNTMNNIRQSIAISILLFSIPLIINGRIKSKVYFGALLAFATTIHNSAIFAISYLLSNIKINLKLTIVILGLSYVFFRFYGSGIVLYLVSTFFGRFDQGIMQTGGSGFGMLAMYSLLFMFLFWIYSNNQNLYNNKKEINSFLVFLEIAIFFQLFATIAATIVRVTFYFFIPVVSLIPMVISVIKDKRMRLMISSSIIVLLLFFMCHFILGYSSETNSNSQGVIPYEFSIN